MREAAKADFSAYLPQARTASGDSLYPCAIAEGIQSGNIITDGNAVLFHHYCGFAFLSGSPDDIFMDYIADRLLHPAPERRFVLISDDPAICSRLSALDGLTRSDRIYYRTEQAPPEFALPDGMALCRITPELLPLIRGRIVPAWSWESPEQFFAHGFGYCVMHKNTAAAAAFTAAAMLWISAWRLRRTTADRDLQKSLRQPSCGRRSSAERPLSGRIMPPIPAA